MLSIQPATLSGVPYICPIPYTMMDPNDTFQPDNPAAVAGQQSWTDSLQLAAQPKFGKDLVFGQPFGSLLTNDIAHTGGNIKYQIENSEPGFTRIGLYLVRCKAAMADQMHADRGLLSVKAAGTVGPRDSGVLGTNSAVTENLDYIVNTSTVGGATYFGSAFNRKYWDVLYHREIGMGHPGASGTANTTSANNSTPLNNALVATGTIKLPAAGPLAGASLSPNFNLLPDGDGGDRIRQRTCAAELGILDQRKEDCMYLVAIQNGVSGDAEAIKMSLFVTDYYSASN